MREEIVKAKRIIFKFGTNILRNDDGDISLSRIYSFIEEISKLQKQGKEVIIVTSGAVGLGAKKLGLDISESIQMKQACAAIGQTQLMSIYENGFEKYGINVAQILLTEDDFSQRARYLSLRNTLNKLIDMRVIPVINQNDTVSTNALEYYKDIVEVCFADNDKLSALLASEMQADLLIILSDINGLYTDNPKENADAEFIPVVERVTDEIQQMGAEASLGGRGGMKTKLEAAKVVTRAGGCLLIANGKEAHIITKIFNEENVGTIFLPSDKLSGKKHWIAYATNVMGTLIVNDGAKKAIIETGSSLLAKGIVEVEMNFNKGDIVSIKDYSGNEFARGIVNYDGEECKKLMGEHSDTFIEKIGYKTYDEIIGRDNIVIL